MQDSNGRPIEYLRLSVTPACAMRCIYCRPGTLDPAKPRSLLSPDEIEGLVRHLVENHGLRKVRLTGGEPTSRSDLPDIVRRLARLDLHDLAMTTNGLTLARQAKALAACGLRRVNVSLDSLDTSRFRRMTGVDGLAQVRHGLDAAAAAGLDPVKLNTVVIRGENDHEIPALLRFAADRGMEIRFIELMPMGPLAGRWAERFVSEPQMRQRLEGEVHAWKALPMGSDSARRYRVCLANGQMGTVGFITAMSCPFCGGCNRIRIGADGTYYPCLMDRPAGTLMPAIRPAFRPAELDHILRTGLHTKRQEHPAAGVGVMTLIGG
jgi:cyclic pyranopterin phosphate synthase